MCDPAWKNDPLIGVGPWAGRLDSQELTIEPGFRRMEAHGQAPHAQHRIQAPSRSGISGRRDPAWARQASRHRRNLIRVWVQKYEAGAFDEDAAAADLLQQYEARIAALERLVGKQALELEFVKGAVRSAPRPKSANTSVIVGPRASASQKDAG
jgi:transposase